MKSIFTIVTLLLGETLFAAYPRIDTESVKLKQGAGELVTVDYVLADADAIVTVDFLTNGVSIGEQHFKTLAGDVNRIVAKGARRLAWRPTAEWFGARFQGEFAAKLTAWPLSSPPDYLVVRLNLRFPKPREALSFYVSTNALPKGALANRGEYANSNMVFRLVHAAGHDFRMGCPRQLELSLSTNNRQPPFMVSFSRDYYLAIYECTQGQFAWQNHTVDATKPLVPVHNLAYTDIRGSTKGINWPNDTATDAASAVDDSSIIAAFRTATGIVDADLPTEAEWEYAARAGTYHNFYPLADGVDHDVVDENSAEDVAFAQSYGWTSLDAGGIFHEVGLKSPNAWGFYDMGGNAGEFVLDRMGFKAGSSPVKTDGSPVNDPKGVATGSSRVARGGCLVNGPNDCRVWSASPCDQTTRSSYSGYRLRLYANLDYLNEE